MSSWVNSWPLTSAVVSGSLEVEGCLDCWLDRFRFLFGGGLEEEDCAWYGRVISSYDMTGLIIRKVWQK